MIVFNTVVVVWRMFYTNYFGATARMGKVGMYLSFETFYCTFMLTRILLH
jgi:hypothetical protein